MSVIILLIAFIAGMALMLFAENIAPSPQRSLAYASLGVVLFWCGLAGLILRAAL